MSQRYGANEPPTQGKVLVRTTVGDIDLELWPKEAPLAARNFCQLCLEGYYDGLAFHRVVKDFMAQTGDPSGTGTGGESIYGKHFKDEVHSRIRFNRAGQVAMASIGDQPNSNGSQFFITLGPSSWLDQKHTIFAKVTGNTIYNVLKLNEVEVGEDDAPLGNPPRILSTEVLANPFDDIVIRSTAQQRAVEAAEKRALKEAKRKRKKTKHLDKANENLMTFAGIEDEAEDQDDNGGKTDDEDKTGGQRGTEGIGNQTVSLLRQGELAAERKEGRVQQPSPLNAVADDDRTLLDSGREKSPSTQIGSELDVDVKKNKAELEKHEKARGKHEKREKREKREKHAKREKREKQERLEKHEKRGNRESRDKHERDEKPNKREKHSKRSKHGKEKRSDRGVSLSETESRQGHDEHTKSGVKRPRLESEELLEVPFSSSAQSKSRELEEEARALREEIRAAQSLKNPGSSDEKAATSKAPMSALEQRRAKFLQKKKPSKNRQDTTLAKLELFNSKLREANRKNVGAEFQSVPTDQTRDSKEEYRGGIGENKMEDESMQGKESSLAWMSTQLKFKKHIDDQFRLKEESLPAVEVTVLDSNTQSGRLKIEELSRGR